MSIYVDKHSFFTVWKHVCPFGNIVIACPSLITSGFFNQASPGSPCPSADRHQMTPRSKGFRHIYKSVPICQLADHCDELSLVFVRLKHGRIHVSYSKLSGDFFQQIYEKYIPVSTWETPEFYVAASSEFPHFAMMSQLLTSSFSYRLRHYIHILYTLKHIKTTVVLLFKWTPTFLPLVKPSCVCWLHPTKCVGFIAMLFAGWIIG